LKDLLSDLKSLSATMAEEEKSAAEALDKASKLEVENSKLKYRIDILVKAFEDAEKTGFKR
jgi:regulator of replication initiation timing